MKLCGIDVGTTGVKAAVFSEEGEMLGYGMETYGISFPRPGYAEQDGEVVWEKAKLALRQAISQAGGDISAISVSTQGDALLLLDKDGHLIAPVQLGMDYRSTEQVKQLNEEFGKEWLFEQTGMPSHPLNFFPKLVWVTQNQPDLFSKTWKAVTYADFFLIRLSGVAKIDATMAGRTMAVNLKTGRWDESLLGAVAVEEERLSEICSSGTAVGTILPQLADELGISPKALIVAGGHDQVCAALGAGVSREGIGLDSHGTAEVLSTALSVPVLTKEMREAGCPCYPHGVPGKYFTFGLNHTGGVSLQQFKELFRYDSYDEFMGSLPDEPVSLLTVPSFVAEENGVGFGTITGLTLATTREEIAKSLLEGLGFEMRRFLELFDKAGTPLAELRCVGGGARSSVGLQLKADIYDRPVSTLHVREASCLGAALLAGTAAGVYPSVEDGMERTVRKERTYMPDASRAQWYGQRYEAYKALCQALGRSM